MSYRPSSYHLGQAADMDFTTTETARAEAGVRGTWPSTTPTTPTTPSGTKAGGSTTGGSTTTSGKAGGTSVSTPTSASLISAPQSGTPEWLPWVLGGAAALGALGLVVAFARS